MLVAHIIIVQRRFWRVMQACVPVLANDQWLGSGQLYAMSGMYFKKVHCTHHSTVVCKWIVQRAVCYFWNWPCSFKRQLGNDFARVPASTSKKWRCGHMVWHMTICYTSIASQNVGRASCSVYDIVVDQALTWWVRLVWGCLGNGCMHVSNSKRNVQTTGEVNSLQSVQDEEHADCSHNWLKRQYLSSSAAGVIEFAKGCLTSLSVLTTIVCLTLRTASSLVASCFMPFSRCSAFLLFGWAEKVDVLSSLRDCLVIEALIVLKLGVE